MLLYDHVDIPVVRVGDRELHQVARHERAFARVQIQQRFVEDDPAVALRRVAVQEGRECRLRGDGGRNVRARARLIFGAQRADAALGVCARGEQVGDHLLLIGLGDFD